MSDLAGDDLAGALERLLVRPGQPARLAHRDPAWDGGEALRHLSHHELRERAQAALTRSVRRLEAAHELLWASGSHALLVVLAGMDAAGKDGTVRHVMSGVNPQGVEVVSFKQPTAEESSHDFLWRTVKALPARGRMTIFNRSHYEEVVAVRVHPEWLERQRISAGRHEEAFWRRRYESINAFEHHIARNGTRIVKLFLHLSAAEQRRRLLARLADPAKEWKFSAADLAERAHWDEHMSAYEDAITATSTPWAPWHVIPADRKPLLRVLAAAVIVEAIRSLELASPTVSAEQHAANERARAQLEAEEG